MIKLHSFINIFHQLWKAGDTAHIDLNTHAGQAWIGIRTPLGHYGQTHQYSPQYPPYTPQTPTHHKYPPHSHTNRSPSYFRRQERRKAAKAAEVTTSNTVEITTEQVDNATTHNNTSTEEVDSTEATIEITSAEQVDNATTHNNTSTSTSTEEVDFTAEQVEELCETIRKTLKTALTTEEVESTIDDKTIESTEVNTEDNTIPNTDTPTIPNTTPATTTPTTTVASNPTTPTTPTAMHPITPPTHIKDKTNDNDALIEKFQAIFKAAASTITKNNDTNTEEIKKSITPTTIVPTIPATPSPTKPVTTIDPITPTTPAAMNPIKLPTHNKDKTNAPRWKKHNKPPLL